MTGGVFQSDHFVALRDILSQLGHPWSPGIEHVKFGRVRGMSTRRGEVVFLSDILDEAAGRVRTRQEQSQSEYRPFRVWQLGILKYITNLTPIFKCFINFKSQKNV